jgi:hypothetical protein
MENERRRQAQIAMLHEETRLLAADLIARRLVRETDSYRARHFEIFRPSRPNELENAPTFGEYRRLMRQWERDWRPPFAYHWTYKNTFGVSFKKVEADLAQDWVRIALLAGFIVFYSRRKAWPGAGQGLAHGVAYEDMPHLEQAIQSAAP